MAFADVSISRRDSTARDLRWVVMVFLAAAGISVIAGLSSEAAELTSFTEASPKAREGVTIGNGEHIELKVTLKGKQGIPGKTIRFYISPNNKRRLLGEATTDAQGVATLKKPVKIEGLKGRN